jgi:hypothetical protein
MQGAGEWNHPRNLCREYGALHAPDIFLQTWPAWSCMFLVLNKNSSTAPYSYVNRPIVYKLHLDPTRYRDHAA